MKDRKATWRKKVREYLAEAFGGKCTICGYDKCLAAFDYHHINPKEKDHQLGVAMRNGGSWAKIVEEARKCTLVCCRCHRELHAGIVELPKNYARFNEDYADVIKVREKEFDQCHVCGEIKNVLQKHCSKKCLAKSQRRFEISKEELEELIQVMPYTKIGEKYGVSGNTIKKRCEILGIKTESRRGYWSKKRM